VAVMTNIEWNGGTAARQMCPCCGTWYNGALKEHSPGCSLAALLLVYEMNAQAELLRLAKLGAAAENGLNEFFPELTCGGAFDSLKCQEALKKLERGCALLDFCRLRGGNNV
jgi:hypothetical protein